MDLIFDEDFAICPKCNSHMREAGGGSATQDNLCDVDWTHYKCDQCGYEETDI